MWHQAEQMVKSHGMLNIGWSLPSGTSNTHMCVSCQTCPEVALGCVLRNACQLSLSVCLSCCPFSDRDPLRIYSSITNCGPHYWIWVHQQPTLVWDCHVFFSPPLMSFTSMQIPSLAEAPGDCEWSLHWNLDHGSINLMFLHTQRLAICESKLMDLCNLQGWCCTPLSPLKSTSQ